MNDRDPRCIVAANNKRNKGIVSEGGVVCVTVSQRVSKRKHGYRKDKGKYE